MYLKQLQLKNINCFQNQLLDFTKEEQPCPWTVIIGENGTGKSTILQILSLALLGVDQVREVSNELDWWKLIRKGETQGKIDVVISDTDQNIYPINFLLEIDTTNQIILGLPDDMERKGKSVNVSYDHRLNTSWFACGYGPWRRLPPPKAFARSNILLTESRRKSQRFATIFNPEVALTVVSDWLVDLEFRHLKEPNNRDAQKALNLATQAIEAVLLDTKFKRITPDGKVIIEENGIELPIEQLSDGYRSTLSWIVDLVRRLVDAFPEAEYPLKARGVVLVDEIDIHLHPKWQRQIVENVRQLFPNLQFIVTSHSPFIVQDMREEDKILVLHRQDKEVIAVDDTDSVEGWRVDQILTSHLFGLKTTRNQNIAKMEDEYQQLLTLNGANKLTPKEKERLQNVESWLHNHQSYPGETPDENVLYQAAQTMIDLLDKQLAEHHE